MRQPTRVAGATGRLQVVVFLAASLWISAFRASGTDGVSFRLFFGNDHDKFVYCSVQLAREACLDAAIRQASFLERTLSESCPSARDTASVEIIEFRKGVAPSSARQCGFFSWEALGECQDCLLLWECRASETSSAIGRSNPCTPSDNASAELGLFAQRQIQQTTLSCTILALH